MPLFCREVEPLLKRLRCLLLALFLFSMVSAVRAEEAVEHSRVEQARQSLVHLYGMGTNSETGQRSRWTGTGFAVGIAGADSDIFLTNWHVATGSGKYADEQVELWLLKDDARFDSDQRPLPDSGIKCRVLITTDGYPDVAVIQALEPIEGYKALPLLSSARAANGTPVFALGYPGLKGSRYGADSGPEDALVTAGVIKNHLIMTQAGGSKSIIHSAPIVHGFSGGPLVNDQGVVVAQNTYGFEENVSTELFCAVYIDYGIELLGQLNIPCTIVQGPSRITVLVADLLRMPDIRPLPAIVIFSFGCLAILVFIRCFIKTAREAVQEFRRRKEDAHED